LSTNTEAKVVTNIEYKHRGQGSNYHTNTEAKAVTTIEYKHRGQGSNYH
jgi:hypothetical protein